MKRTIIILAALILTSGISYKVGLIVGEKRGSDNMIRAVNRDIEYIPVYMHWTDTTGKVIRVDTTKWTCWTEAIMMN